MPRDFSHRPERLRALPQTRPNPYLSESVEAVKKTPRPREFATVLLCYLDDSGKDAQNPITTLAGFIAKDDEWRRFETEVEPTFTKYGVKVLHTKDLHHTTGEFTNWKVLQKQFFVSGICRALSQRVPLGVSMSALKGIYKTRATESNRKRTVSPYTFCLSVIIDWILRDIRVGRSVHAEGVTFILERGHQNNAEAEDYFHSVRRLFPELEGVLRSIEFVSKESCRAIQAADLLAFYSRRHGVAMERAPLSERAMISPESIMNIITGNLPIRAFVATDFGPESGSRFLAGDLGLER